MKRGQGWLRPGSRLAGSPRPPVPCPRCGGRGGSPASRRQLCRGSGGLRRGGGRGHQPRQPSRGHGQHIRFILLNDEGAPLTRSWPTEETEQTWVSPRSPEAPALPGVDAPQRSPFQRGPSPASAAGVAHGWAFTGLAACRGGRRLWGRVPGQHSLPPVQPGHDSVSPSHPSTGYSAPSLPPSVWRPLAPASWPLTALREEGRFQPRSWGGEREGRGPWGSLCPCPGHTPGALPGARES